MWIFFRKKDVRPEVHKALQASFHNVKRDTINIFHWLKFLYNRTNHHEHQIQHLADQVYELRQMHPENIKYGLYSELRSDLKPIIDEEVRVHLADFRERNDRLVKQVVREAIDEYYLYHDMHSKLNLLQKQITELKNSPIIPIVNSEPLNQRLNQLEERKSSVKARLREKVLKSITKNSKDYIKNLLVSMIHKYQKISAHQLREMIVEEQGLCSKSSFYRILDEIGELSGISTMREGKEKTFFAELHAVNKNP